MKIIIALLNGERAILRQATKEDAIKLMQYLQDIAGETDFLTFGPGELMITQEIEEKIIEENMDQKNKVMLIVEYRNEIIANLSFNAEIRQRVKHTGEFGVCVKRAFWNNGIAEKLIKSLILWAQENKMVTKINLRVREDNDKAIRLYKRIGFIEEGKVTREFLVDEVYYSSLLMGLEL